MCTVAMVFRPRLGHQHPIVAGHIYLGCSKLICDHRSQNWFALPSLSWLKHVRFECFPLQTQTLFILDLNDCEDKVVQGQQKIVSQTPLACVSLNDKRAKENLLLKSCIRENTGILLQITWDMRYFRNHTAFFCTTPTYCARVESW